MNKGQGGLTLLLAAGLLALAALLAWPQPAQAGPPAPVDIPLTQPDGTRILARQWGDEHQHGYETPDGYTLLQSAAGPWVYAISDGQGGLLPARDAAGGLLIAGQADPVALSALPRHARPAAAPAPASSAAPMLQPATGGFGLDGASFGGSLGSQPVLVLLVEFTDRTHRYSADTYRHSLFGESGSVRAFYRQASFGKLDLSPAVEDDRPVGGLANDGVVGWLRLPLAHPNSPFASPQTVSAALAAADPYVNFKQYDQNGDGYLSNRELHLVVVAAGYEQSYCGSPCSAGAGIWAHRMSLDAALPDPQYYPHLDGTYLAISRSISTGLPVGGGYAIFGEIHGAGWDDHPATIGVMAHELGHDLAMPDLYDTTNTSAGVGNWSIMGSGSWNGLDEPGDSPALPDAWSKWYEGWIKPTSGADGSTISVGAAANSAFALLLGTNENGVDWAYSMGSGTGEYWLVENREPAGFDAGLPGCGLLVWHVDESLAPDNNVNSNREHPMVELEQADGLRDLYNRRNRGDAGDPFPGSTGRVSFTPGDGTLVNPASRYYSKAVSGYSFDLGKAYCDRSIPVTFHGLAPSLSPARLYLPGVTFGLQTGSTYTGQATANNSPLEGALMKLTATRAAADGWQTTSVTDVAATGADGRFFFPRLPSVGGGNSFVVRYDNATDSTRLLRFTCGEVNGSAADRYTCSPNLANVALVSPQYAAAVSLPVTFRWTPRASPTDSYILELYAADGMLLALSEPLGYTDHLDVGALPTPLFQPNTTYLWTVRVVTPDGEGYAYMKNSLTFTNVDAVAGPALMVSPLH